MPKSSPRRKKPKQPSRRRHDDVAVRRLSPAIAVVRGHQAAFRSWLTEPDGDDGDAALVVDDLEVLLGLARGAGMAVDPLRVAPGPLAELSRALPGGHERAVMLRALGLWLEFAESAGLWASTAAELAACRAVLASPGRPPRVAPGPEEVAAAVSALPLRGCVVDLLTWVRPGRGVTATGAVRRADLLQAGALAGAQLHEGSDRHSGRPALLRPTSDPQWPVPVHTMSDVWHLERLWRALAAEGLLDVGRTRVHLTPAGERVLQDGATWQVVHDVAVSALTAMLGDPGDNGATFVHRGEALRGVLEHLVLGAGDPRHDDDGVAVSLEELSFGALAATPSLQVLDRWGVVRFQDWSAVTVGHALVPLLATALLGEAADRR